jgi:hypothetical protein
MAKTKNAPVRGTRGSTESGGNNHTKLKAVEKSILNGHELVSGITIFGMALPTNPPGPCPKNPSASSDCRVTSQPSKQKQLSELLKTRGDL